MAPGWEAGTAEPEAVPYSGGAAAAGPAEPGCYPGQRHGECAAPRYDCPPAWRPATWRTPDPAAPKMANPWWRQGEGGMNGGRPGGEREAGSGAGD